MRVNDNNKLKNVSSIKVKYQGIVTQASIMIINLNGVLYTIWELISSTFLDKLGNVFCDKNGVPFMGKDS